MTLTEAQELVRLANFAGSIDWETDGEPGRLYELAAKVEALVTAYNQLQSAAAAVYDGYDPATSDLPGYSETVEQLGLVLREQAGSGGKGVWRQNTVRCAAVSTRRTRSWKTYA